MGKTFISTPEAIRNAGKNISSIDAMAYHSEIECEVILSKGHMADGIQNVLLELKNIKQQLDRIAEQLPQKLDRIAETVERGELAAAEQFK